MDRISLYWKNATAEAVGEKHGVNEKELKELAPRVTRAAVMFNPETAPYAEYFLRPLNVAAPKLGVKAFALAVRSDLEIQKAMIDLGRDKLEAKQRVIETPKRTDPAVSTATLRTNAQGPITFLCATIGSGVRLGGDRDEDGTLNGSDCAPGDAGARSLPVEAAGFALSGKSPTSLTWTEQASATGPGILYDVVGGTISVLRSSGLSAATSCVGSALGT